ncbi:MAG: c-type cytochrome domain-containing protein [Chitinophagaceae bacterium]
MLFIVNIVDVIGHVHPLLVHLPIGFLVLGGVFYFLSLRENFASLHYAALVAVGLGFFAALTSCITGYVLSLGNDYINEPVSRHQYLAILTTGLSLLWTYLLATDQRRLWQQTTAVVTLVALLITGHWGGVLTHGEHYLFPSDSSATIALKGPQPLQDIPQAVLYTDVVQPILNEKCVSCHGPAKKKAKLRLDQPEWIRKGGEDGEVVRAADPVGSELIRRIELALDAKAHMPPREKHQLSAAEIQILHWWVESGLSFDQKIGALQPSETILAAFRTLGRSASSGALGNRPPELPPVDVPAADPKILLALRERGIAAIPVSQNSHFLAVSFFSTDSLQGSDLDLLKGIGEQVVAVNAGHQSLSDSHLQKLEPCIHLMTLRLDRTTITDRSIPVLARFKALTSLHLSGTNISAAGLSPLAQLKQLKRLTLYGMPFSDQDWKKLQTLFPSTQIEGQGYSVPLLESDTVEVKPK